MIKHTPGPWHNKEGYRFLNARSDKGVVADIRIVGGVITPEDKANARLIAAAPDMLQALRDIAAETTGYDNEDIIAAIQGICRAAITKAQGKD
jgi:hypothetical protein